MFLNGDAITNEIALNISNFSQLHSLLAIGCEFFKTSHWVTFIGCTVGSPLKRLSRLVIFLNLFMINVEY